MDENKTKTEMNLEERFQKINEFLSLFDNPLVIQLPEKDKPNPKWFWIHDNTINLIANNLDWKCWLHFCPNGSRGRINNVWQKIVRSEKDVIEWCTISCLVFDFDFKDQWEKYSDIDDMIDNIRKHCKLTDVEPTYIFKSWWWAHVYFMFDKEDVDIISSALWDRVLKVSTYAAKLRWADYQCWATCRLSWTIRVPYSYNNKYDPAKAVELVYENKERYLTLWNLEVLVDAVESQQEALQKKEALKMSIWKQSDLIKIPMPDMLEKLKNYPRVMPDWRRQVMEIQKDQVYIYEVEWDVSNLQIVKKIKWNSYKYNRDKNYIKCFCMWDISEAPEGNWFWFLYHYFLKNVWDVENFLIKEYDISINQQTIWANVAKITVENKWIEIIFWEKWVKFVTWDWENSKIMFDQLIIPKWKWYVRQSKIWEWDMDQRAYIFDINWREEMIIKKTTKKEHNKSYPWMFCYLNDNQLNEFFNAIDICEDVPEVKIYEKNWYYDWVVILGWQDIDWNLNWWLVCTQYEYTLNYNKTEQISVYEFFEDYLKIYNRNVAIPTFLQSLALAWMNLRESHNTYPWLLVTGLTGSGKSSIMSLMKSMLWYWPSARQFSLPWLTAQPLKQAASDYSVLFLEELTNRVSEATEELLRNVINRDKASRGQLDSNITFDLYSPLFIVWERALKDESLNNRFVTTVVSRRDWLADSRTIINELWNKTASLEIYRTRSECDPEVINRRYTEVSLRLSRQDLDSRNADTYAYMFVAKDVFNIDISDDELLQIVKMWIKKTWVWQSATFDDKWVIKSYLIRSVMNNQSNVTVTNENSKIHVEVLFLDDSWYEKAKSSLNTAIVNFNDEIWYEAFHVNSQWMTCDFDAIRWPWWWFTEECKLMTDFWSSAFWWMRWNGRCFHYQCDIDI